MDDALNRRLTALTAALTGAVILLLFALNTWYAEPNQDEGWYLMSGRLVSEGKTPWRDFSFSQGPVVPYVYALATPLVKSAGVLGGRLFTGTLGLAALGLMAGLAWLLSPEKLRGTGALLALILGGINVYQTGFLVIPKTYSASALFLGAGFVLSAISVLRLQKFPAWRMVLSGFAGFCFALAGASRMSAAFAAAAPFAFLWLEKENLGKLWIPFLSAYAGGLLLLFVPFLAMGGQAFRFWFWTYHMARSVDGKLLFKAAFISQVAQAWLIPCAAAVMALAWYGLETPRQRSFRLPLSPMDKRARNFLVYTLGAIGLVTLVHIGSPFPYPDYQVFLAPTLCAALAAMVLRLLADRLEKDRVLRLWLVASAWLVAVAVAFSSPINREWFQAGRELIWWKSRHRSALADVRAAGAELKRMAPAGSVLFTQDAYLAIESGLRLPPGLEMGPFSYFPDLSRDEALRFHVVNRDLMLEALRSGQVAAVSGYGFAIASPKIKPVPYEDQKWWREEVDKRYARTATLTGFGQGQTTLELFIRR